MAENQSNVAGIGRPREVATPSWFAADALAARAMLILGITIFFCHIGAYGLWEPDEARYAEIAREMVSSGGWIVPHLNYVAYVEKPPLLYWLTAISFWTFGVHAAAARAISALAALGGLVATFFFTHRTFGRRHALVASAVLATSPLYAVMAQVLTTDMLLSAFVACALYAFYMHYLEGGRWCWWGYIAMAAATMTKGPVGIVLPVASMGLFLLWQHELRGAIARFHAIAGALLVAILVAPWFVAMSAMVPGFADFYFVGENFRRVLDPTYSHGEAFYYYVPVLLVGMLPWSMLVPILAWRGMKPNPARRFCVCASVVIVGVFTLASSKLIPYVLPAIAPLSILIADGIVACAWPDEGERAPLRSPDTRLLGEAGPLLVILGIGVAVVALASPLIRSPYVHAVRFPMYAIGAILIVGGLTITAAFFWRRMNAGLTMLVLTMTAALVAGTWVRIDAEPLRSYAALSRVVAERAPEATMICFRRYVQALPFYTHKRVIVIGSQGELEFGASRAPDASEYFMNSENDLIRLWSEPRQTVVVLDAPDLVRLSDRLGSYTLIASEHTKRAIVNSALSRGISDGQALQARATTLRLRSGLAPRANIFEKRENRWKK